MLAVQKKRLGAGALGVNWLVRSRIYCSAVLSVEWVFAHSQTQPLAELASGLEAMVFHWVVT